MKSKSIQQSLLQQILALDQDNFQSYNISKEIHNDLPIQSKSISCHKQDIKQNKNRNSYNRASSCSITDLEDQILRMRIQMTRQLHDKNSKQKNKKNNNIKTQISHDNQLHGHAMNYSTIYTRRSSLDQSLYDKAIKQQNVRKIWIDKKKKQKQHEQLKECSYRPEINQTSKIIMSRVDKQQLYDKIKKKKQQEIRKIKQEQIKKQMKQCSFTPNLISKNKMVRSVQVEKFMIQEKNSNNNTTTTTNNKNINNNNRNNNNNNNRNKELHRHSVSVFDHLYQQSKTRQLKNKKVQQNYSKQYTKKPQIDQISRIITQNTKFQQRQLKYQQRKIQKQLKTRQKQNKQIKQSYRPSINSISQSRKIQTSIGQHLYLLSKKNNNKYKFQSANTSQQTKIQINKKSNEVYEERKTLVFYQIFKLLDGDQDGSISINHIDINMLPREIVKIIYPLIEELQVMEVLLHQNEFINSISNLFKTLTVHEKNILLGFVGGPIKQQNTQSFHPKINNKSKIITACNQRSQMSIYQYCSIREKQRQRLLEGQRVQKSKRQLENCTFQPKVIIKYRR